MSPTEIVCTRDHPWDKVERKSVRVIHPDADEVGEQRDGWPAGDMQTYECPHCGHRFEIELPQ
jgi:hypothetical protein